MVFAAGCAAAGLIAAAIAWPSLPEQMPTHWGVSGEPDGWGPRGVAVAIGPITSLSTAALIWGLARLGPRQEHLARSAGALGAFVGAMGAFGLVLHGLILRAALADDPSLGSGIELAVAGLFAVLGLVVPRVKSNHWVGIRTPWALDDEANWHRTQRIGGFGLLGAAAVIAASTAIPDPAWRLGILLTASILLVAIVPVTASWWWSRQDLGTPHHPG